MLCPHCHEALEFWKGRFWLCERHGQVTPAVALTPDTRWLPKVAQRYPYPIAFCYEALQEEAEACTGPRDALRVLLRIRDVIETLIKYLAIVQISARGRRPDASDPLDGEIVARLVAPSLGTWDQGLLRRLTKAAHAAGDRRLEPLYQYLFREGSPIPQEFGAFAELRNRVIGHGMMRTPDQDEADVREWLPRLNAVLEQADFLTRWELVTFGERPLSWMGRTPSVRETSADASPPSGAGLDGQFTLLLEGGEAVPLYSFLARLACPGCADILRLFLYDGQKRYDRRKLINMLEIEAGHKETFTEPAEGLERLFPPELLSEFYRSYRRRFEVLEGKLAEFDFSVYRERNREFVGREFLFGEVEDFLHRQDRGYFLLTGEAGIGKTAFLTQWIEHNRFEPLSVRFYYRRGRNLSPDDFTRHCYQQLLARYSLEDREPPRDGQECARKLDSLLQTLSRNYLGRHDKLILVVDAIDEAGDTERRQRAIEAIPRALPRGIYCLISSRSVRELDILAGEPCLRRFHLRADHPRNRDDLRLYLRSALSAELAAGLVTEPVLARVEEAADGNFLWAHELIQALRLGTLRFSDVAERLPSLSDLDGLYREFWSRVTLELPPDEERRLWRVVGVLAAARRPLTAEQAAAFAEVTSDEFLVTLRRMQQYVDVVDSGEAGEVAKAEDAEDGPSLLGYRLYHSSFQEYLTRQPDFPVREQHLRIADFYLKSGDEFRDWDRYGLDAVPYHLLQAGAWEALAALLTDLNFIEAKCASGMIEALQDDYAAALDRWPGYRREDPFPPSPGSPVEPWIRDCVRAVIDGGPDPHPDCGAGAVLARLRERFPAPGKAQRQRRGFVPDEAAAAGEAPSEGGLSEGNGTRDSPTAGGGSSWESSRPPSHLTHARDVHAFANWVAAYSHILAEEPDETIPIARNQAGGGPVALRAEPLAASLERPWIGRDPRAPAPPLYPACIRMLRGHTGSVTALAITADGRTALSGSYDGTVRVWELQSGRCRHVLQGHSGRITSVAMTPDGRIGASGTGMPDGTVRIWDLTKGEELQVLEAAPEMPRWASAVALSTDGRLLVSAALTGPVYVWDLETGRRIRRLGDTREGAGALALTPDAKLAVTADPTGEVSVWDVQTGERCRIPVEDDEEIRRVDITRDGRFVVMLGEEGLLSVWDLLLGCQVRVLRGPSCHGVAITGEGGRLFLAQRYEGLLHVWDLERNCEARSLHAHPYCVKAVAATPAGEIAVTGSHDQTIRVWDLHERTVAHPSPDLPGAVRALFVGSAYGKGVSLASQERGLRLLVWDLERGAPMGQLETPADRVTLPIVSPDGRWVACGGSDNLIRVWELGAGRRCALLKGHTQPPRHLAGTPDGSILVSTGFVGDNSVRLWQANTGRPLRVLRGHSGCITGLSLTPDGRFAVTSGATLEIDDGDEEFPMPVEVREDHDLRVWDLATGACRHVLTGHDNDIFCFEIAPDGRLVVSASIFGGELRLWDLHAGKLLRGLDLGRGDVRTLTISPDGRLAAVGINPSFEGAGAMVLLWDLRSGATRRLLKEPARGIGEVAFAPDGRTLFAGDYDHALRLWDVETGECLTSYFAGGAPESRDHIRPDGRILGGVSEGQLVMLTVHNRQQMEPIVTAVRQFHLKADEPPPSGGSGALFGTRPSIRGEYDTRVTARCPWCGTVFELAKPVTEAIRRTAEDAGLTPGRFSLIELSDTAWTAPDLLSTCPCCGRGLRFNPFVVDGCEGNTRRHDAGGAAH